MTNEIKDIKILGFEDKPETKTGSPHCIFQTDKGMMGCFEHEYIIALKGLPDGNSVEVEVGYSTDGKYVNIRKVTGIQKSKEAKPQIDNQGVAAAVAIAANRGPNRTSVKGTAYEKDPVGLAIDVFCQRKEITTIIEAVEIIKAAQKAFS